MLIGSDLQCQNINSTSPAFSIRACHRPSICGAVDILIERTDPVTCAAAEGAPGTLNNDSSLDEWMRKDVGPDAFMLLTDGAERRAMYKPTAYEPGCKYRFSLRMNNGGPFDVHLWWQYQVSLMIRHSEAD